MSLMPALSISMSGMKAAQNQLDLVARNIVNVDTVGYTRKTAAQSAIVVAGMGYGVSLSNTQRQVDEGLLKSFLASNATQQNLSVKSDYLGKVDGLLGTTAGGNSIAARLSSFQTAMETFATDVSQSAGRYVLLSNATSLASQLNSLSTALQKLRGEADLAIASDVAKANQLLDTLNALNDSIAKYTVLGYDGLVDLQDKRDQALRDLSGLVDIYYFQRDNGEIVIQTSDGATLLDKDPHYLNHPAIVQSNAATSYEGGGISGIYVDGRDITKYLMNGEIKGLIDIRDNTLVSLQDQLDNLAWTLKDQLNRVHNEGTAYPQSPSSLEGTRTFLDSSAQGISIDDGDVRISIFGLDGKQVATATLVAGLGFSSGTVDQMAADIQAWLQSPTGANLPDAAVYVDPATGHFVVHTNDSNYTISFLDEASSTPGSSQKPVQLSFDVNGDGVYDRQFEGFSYFLGLNDFFTQTQANVSSYDSRIFDIGSRTGLAGITTLSFSLSGQGLDFASVTVYPADTIKDIVDRINNDPALRSEVIASLVPNGNGYVLRIRAMDGSQLEIASTPPDALTKNFGFEPSKAGTAAAIEVRRDIAVNPNLIAGGSPEFNFSSGEYELNSGRNNIANRLADALSKPQFFPQTGTLAQTVSTFANYAASFVGVIATQAASAIADLSYQTELTSSIAMKEAKLSGVDQDEELAQMILFQQSYAAAAKSFTAAKEMLDMLLNLV